MKKRLFAALMVMVVAVSMPVYGASKDEDSSSDVIKVRVAGTADYEPYTYVDEDDNITGYDIEVIKAIDELAPEIECEYSYTQWDTLLPGLDADKFDVVSNQLGETDERKEMYLYPKYPFLFAGSAVISTADDPMDSFEDLKGKKVAVEKGTASHTYASKNLSDSELEVHDTITTAYESLEQKKVDAVIQDGPGASFYIKTTPDSNLEVVGDEFNQGQAPYCVAVSKECKYYDEINAAVKVLIKNGTTDELYAKWCE